MSVTHRMTNEENELNEKYNELFYKYADYGDKEKPIDKTIANGFTHGKRVPYIGWFWRKVDFFTVINDFRYAIGDCGDFIGFMENNKWGYPERYVTTDEHQQIITIVEKAYQLSLTKGEEWVKTALETLFPLMQTFEIKVEE